jgi:hypothetical protein
VGDEQVALAVGLPVAGGPLDVCAFHRHRVEIVLHGVAVDGIVIPGVEQVKVARPLPVPPDEVCSQLALDVAAQAPLVTTMSEALPAVGPSTSAVVPSLLGVRRSSSTSRLGRKRGAALRDPWGARRRVRANSCRIQERRTMGILLAE